MANEKEILDRRKSIQDTMKITNAHVSDLFFETEKSEECAGEMPSPISMAFSRQSPVCSAMSRT